MAIARVQGNSANNNLATASCAVTISAVGSGNTVCGLFSWDAGTSATLTSVTDDKGNNYNLETTITDGVNQSTATFSRTNITNAPVTITATLSINAVFQKLIVDEFSGTSTASSDERDGAAHGGQAQATPGTGSNAITSGTFTTATNGDLLYGACEGSETTTAASNGTSFSAGTTDNTDYVGQSEWRAQTTAGSGTAATFTQAAGSRRVTFLIAIKPAGGGATAHVGEERLAGAGSVSDNALLKMVAQERPAGTGSLSANVTAKLDADVVFGGTGGFSVNVTKPIAPAALAGAGNLSANVLSANAAQARFDGAGNLSIDVKNPKAGEARFSGVGSFSANVVLTGAIAARLNGAGNLSVDAQKLAVNAEARLNGFGNLSSNVIQRQVEGARFAGLGSFSANVTQVTGAVTRTLVSWAQLRGQEPAGAAAWAGQAIWNGVGSLSAFATARLAASAIFTGAGALTVQAQNTKQAAATFSGNGNFSALAVVVSGGQVQFAEAIFAGAGALSANAALIEQVQARFNGAGSFSVQAEKAGTASGSGALNGVGNLSINVKLIASAQATFAGAGGLSALVVERQVIAATFAGLGTFSVDLDKLRAQGEARWNGSGLLSVSSLHNLAAYQTLNGDSTYRVNVTAKYAATIAFTGNGSMLVNVAVRQAAEVRFEGNGNLSAISRQGVSIAARFAGVGGFLPNAFVLAFGSSLMEVTFGGRGGMMVSVTIIGPRHVQSSFTLSQGPVRINEATGGRNNFPTTRRNAA